jgi:hypothetical protein
LFGDAGSVKLLAQEVIDDGHIVDPGENGITFFAVVEAFIEFGANFAGETGNFTGASHNHFLWVRGWSGGLSGGEWKRNFRFPEPRLTDAT